MSYDPNMRRPTPLATTLAAEIARAGAMPVSEYMRRCLWDREHGYYATRQPLGAAGDFITAPEISQTFGELIGLWAAVVWRDHMRAPAAITLAELGPGRGTLLRDALRATARAPGFHDALRCQLVEASEPLIAMQRKALQDFAVPSAWREDLSEVAPPVIVVANEFFDALPVRQWVKSDMGWRERRVEIDERGALRFGVPAQAAGNADLDAAFASAPTGAIIELSEHQSHLRDLAALAARGPLAALVIDYGHTRTAPGETLQAVRGHRHEDPLTSPGEADLSAQVDFEALAATARQFGLAVDGPIPQGEFLGRLGIVERASRLMSANPERASLIEISVGRLIAPDGMGSRFKVLGLRSPELPPLPGLEPGQHRPI